MKISVYITSFNKSQFLSQAINSVLSQTLPASEILIVDDCSTDDSREIINSFSIRYPTIIRPIFNEKNLGISKTRNIALSHCNYDLITFLDGDDIFYNNKLKDESNYLINSYHDVVYSNFNYINSIGRPIGKFSENDDSPAVGDIFVNTLIRDYKVCSGNNYIYEMYYKSHALNIGLYDENIKIWEDWDFRIRMSKKYRFGYCSKIHSAYRKLDTGLSKSASALHFREQIKIYKKNIILIQDLDKGEKELIYNRIYSRMKYCLNDVINYNRKQKNVLSIIFYSIYFILTFKTKKSVLHVLQNITDK